jgi:DNA-binding response OmpR family regulator
LLNDVWKADAEASVAGVRMCVSRLREKLRAHPSAPQLDTVKGFGYRLV